MPTADCRRQLLSLKRFTTKQVLKVIGEPHLRLIDGGGYWCFIYDEESAGVFQTYSIYTARLTDFPFCDWVAEGRGFVAIMKRRNT